MSNKTCPMCKGAGIIKHPFFGYKVFCPKCEDEMWSKATRAAAGEEAK